MQVQLDEELWEMEDSIKLEEVLARISDTAQAKGRLVTMLRVGEKEFSDRDLLPGLLAQTAGTVGNVMATSQSLQHVVNQGADSANKFGESLHSEGATLTHQLRQGFTQFQALDDWLGRLADYVEWVELARSLHASQCPKKSMASWLPEMLQARDNKDPVRLADLLEYEILPGLPMAHA